MDQAERLKDRREKAKLIHGFLKLFLGRQLAPAAEIEFVESVSVFLDGYTCECVKVALDNFAHRGGAFPPTGPEIIAGCARAWCMYSSLREKQPEVERIAAPEHRRLTDADIVPEAERARVKDRLRNLADRMAATQNAGRNSIRQSGLIIDHSKPPVISPELAGIIARNIVEI